MAVKGLVVNGALYIALVFMMALHDGNRWAMYGAIVTAGIAFVSYNFQNVYDVDVELNRKLSWQARRYVWLAGQWTALLSIATAVAAGVALFF